jgi:hypothetical protein
MDLGRIRGAIEEAVSLSVHGIQVPGIVDAGVRNAAVSSEQLERLANRLAQHGYDEIKLSAEIELYLRVSNTDLLGVIERTEFRVRVNAEENDLQAVASSKTNWELAWERGMEPIKEAALQGIRRDVLNMDGPLAEDSYTFQAATVLLASEFVGPYVDRIATFVGYPPALVQVMAARLYEAGIWEGDEVRCESWFDPQVGGIALLLAVMVTEGKLIGRWSKEEKQFAYREPEVRAVSRLAV